MLPLCCLCQLGAAIKSDVHLLETVVFNSIGSWHGLLIVYWIPEKSLEISCNITVAQVEEPCYIC